MKKITVVFCAVWFGFICCVMQLSAQPQTGVELLIYDMDHWMDALTPAEITQHERKQDNFRQKYEARYQRGDVIEIRPLGFWTGEKKRGFNYDAFRVLVVKQVDFENAKYLIESSSTKKRRYSVSTGAGTKVTTLSNVKNLSVKDKGP